MLSDVERAILDTALEKYRRSHLGGWKESVEAGVTADDLVSFEDR
jgi:hypothetical protein